jgi:F1F0 ATPase subunit 2
MNNIALLLMALAAGILLGLFFFGGLWITAKKALVSTMPQLWFFVSLIIRLGVTLIVFYWVGRNHWDRMLVCLAGFIVARFVLMRFVQLPKLKKPFEKEVKYENES